MILKKCSFPIFTIITSAILLLLLSCKNDVFSKKINNPEYGNFLLKAESYYKLQKLDSAIFYYYKARSVCSSDEVNNISYALYFIAEIQQKQCDFSGSETTATESLNINPNYSENYSFFNLLGLNYQEQNDFNEAIKYYKLSQNQAKTKLEQFVIENNIAYVNLESKQYSKAKAILERIVTYDSLIASKENYAKVLDNLGFAYFKLNQPQAIDYLYKSLEIRDGLKIDSESIASYMHLSEYYQNINPSFAKDFAQKAYNCATAINSPDDRIEAIKFLITSSSVNDVKSLALKQMNISDSINKIRQNSKIQFAKIKYDANIALKESERQKSQK
jgi:tetratricopeptide (TPR) repeat protein